MGPLVPVALEIARVAAPGLIRWLSGSDKAAAVAEELVGVAQEVTGATSPAAAVQRLRADPALVLQLQARTVEIDARLEEAYLADRQDARKMTVELAKSGDTSSRDRKFFMVRLDVVGLVLGLAGMVLLGWLKSQYPDSVSDGVFGALLAQLSTITSYFGLCLRDAHQFEFGSSRGSQDKTEMLARGAGKP